MRPFSRTIIVSVFLLIVLGAISLAVIYFNRVDAFVYVFGLWGATCLAAMRWLRGNWKLASWNIAIVLFCLGACEAWLAGWFSKGDPSLSNFTISNPHYFVADDLLGYRSAKDCEVTAEKKYNGEPLYNVKYTIDAQGLRARADTGASASKSVLFFGGSFTFGEGVENDETLPWKFEEKAGGAIRAFNFGFHGYGPHQMLAILENRREAEVVAESKPVAAVYQCIPGHVDRCTGGAWWDAAGPRYVLEPGGTATYAGPFRGSFAANVIRAVARSQIAKKFLAARAAKITAEEVDLLVGIVNSARQILRERYGAELHVLLWNAETDELSASILARLDKLAIPIIKVEDILPDAGTEESRYRIHPPAENHPNALSYDLLASYLVENLDAVAAGR